MLQVDQASVFFKGKEGTVVHALDRVSLSIDEGEFVVALGASGCGKSTLLSAMAGFLPLSSGRITLGGKPVSGPGRDRGVVFQKDSLLPWKTVEENVALGLKFAGWNAQAQQQRVRELLDAVGLDTFAKSAPYELSGGMRQRVGLARALATDPGILLMDEPFGALDSLTREQMQLLLIDVWKKTGKKVFFITHSMDEALLLGTHVLVMSPRPGRITHRFETGFVKSIAQGQDPRALKASTEFIQMRESLRDLIHTKDFRQEPAL